MGQIDTGKDNSALHPYADNRQLDIFASITSLTHHSKRV